MSWTGNIPAYYMTLMYGSNDGNNLGVGGRFSQTNAIGVYRVLGGINLMGNPDYSIGGDGDNAICHADNSDLWTERILKIQTISVIPCQVIYVDPPAVPVKRDYNPSDPENWVVQDVKVPDNWMERGTTVLLDDPSALEKTVLDQLRNLAESKSKRGSIRQDQTEVADPEERSARRTSRQEHLRKHRHGSFHGHAH